LVYPLDGKLRRSLPGLARVVRLSLARLRMAINGSTALTNRGPTCGERRRIESLGGIESLRGPFRCLSAEDPAQDPFAGKPNDAQLVVGKPGRALWVEVQINRQLLDECWVAGSAGGLLEPVGNERCEHLQLADARTNRDADRDRARDDHQPWGSCPPRATGQCADDWDSEDADPLDVLGESLGFRLAGKAALALGRRGDTLVGQQGAVDRLRGKPADRLHECAARF